jgi:hypothetical protein
MRRRLVALAVATLAIAVAPGIAWAIPMAGTLDQSADFGSTMYSLDDPAGVTQTVTVGRTGILESGQLYCAAGGADPVGVTISVDTYISGLTCETAGWTPFFVILPVEAGQQVTISISATEAVELGVAAADYPGGAAANGGAPIDGVADFAFKTYMGATSSTVYSWSVASVQPGVSTPVTLTTQTAFDALTMPAVSGAGRSTSLLMGSIYLVKLGAMPDWFTPTDIHCSEQIATADCTVAAFQAGINATGDRSAMTVVITIDGNAAPPTTAAGGSGTASGQGCFTFPVPNVQPNADSIQACGSGQAVLGVGAAATPPATTAVTLPASTAATRGPASSGSGLSIPAAAAVLAGWLLLGGLMLRRRRIV